MLDPVLCVLRINYYYSRLFGIINFEIDLGTGRARATRRASVFGVLSNLLVIVLLTFLSRSAFIQMLWRRAEGLHHVLYLVVHGTRVLCVTSTVLSRWWQRRQLIDLITAFRRLILRRPEVRRMWRRSVLMKSVALTSLSVLQITVSLSIVAPDLTVHLALGVFMLFTMSIILNTVVGHFYFAILNVHCFFSLLNRDIRQILVETRGLGSECRRATFMIKCCNLADQLEDVARDQAKVQTLLQRITKIFGIQWLCVAINGYLSTMSIIYFMFSTVRQNQIAPWKPVQLVLFAGNVICYFVDLVINFWNMGIVLDLYEDMANLVEHLTMFSSCLDERFQAVIESFQLQLKRNPLKIPVLDLYIISRTSLILLANSFITNSLVLIQYDLKYNSE